MSNVPGNQVLVSGVPIEYIAASEIHLARGVYPWEWRFLTTEPERFRALTNPVVIEITTPDATSINPVTVRLENWYITEITPHSTQTWEVVIRDVRWWMAFKKCNLSFNQRTVDGKYRTETLNNGKPWRVVAAIEKVIAEFGGAVQIDSSLTTTQTGQIVAGVDVILPDNMGNCEAGGWFGASMAECLLPMLELLPADIVPLASSVLLLTDRYYNNTKGLDTAGAYGGIAGPRTTKWQMPGELTLLLQQRCERLFVFEEDAFSGTSSAQEYVVNNVVPVPSNIGIGDDTVKWEPFTTFLSRVGVSLADWRKRYLTDTVIPENAQGSDQQQFDARSYEALGRQHYRLTFRVDLQAAANRVWSGLALGRLGANGLTSPGSSTFTDWLELVQFSYRDPKAAIEDLDSHKFSRNHPIPTKRQLKSGEAIAMEAPYRAQWVSDGKNDLVFSLVEKRLPSAIRMVVPGLAVAPVSYGDAAEIIKPDGDIVLRRRGILRSQYTMVAFYHAILNTDIAGFSERYHKVTKPFHGQGVAPALVLRAEELTANYRCDLDNPLGKGDLLNAAEIDTLYERVKDRFLADYREGIAGMMHCVGVETLTKGYWTGGNIHDTIIRIGGEAAFTITTSFVILPSARKYFGADSRDGAPAEIIG